MFWISFPFSARATAATAIAYAARWYRFGTCPVQKYFINEAAAGNMTAMEETVNASALLVYAKEESVSNKENDRDQTGNVDCISGRE